MNKPDLTNKTNAHSAYQASLNNAKDRAELNMFISLDENIDIDALPSGRLSGMTIALKDTLHATGLPNTAGTAALKNFVPSQDAPAVKQLKNEGAIIIGKTNMHEMAYGITSNNAHFGVAKNPYDPTRFPGGSSGGSAAAVAARVVRAAIAGDTGGSIRIPAALCGIIGFRPSPERYPDDAITPISHTRDVIGPVALEMDDITVIDSVLSGKSEITSAADLKSLRVGVPRRFFFDNLHPDTKSAMENALQIMSKAGVTLVEVDLPDVKPLLEKTGMPIALYETMIDLPAYLEKHQTNVSLLELAAEIQSPDVRGLFDMLCKDENGDGTPDGLIPKEVYDEAMTQHRPALIKIFDALFDTQRLDAIAFPTTVLPAGPAEGSIETVALNGEQVPTFEIYTRNAEPGSLVGMPGITLPIGLSADGLPLAMELDGRRGNDDHLLAVARAIEPLFGKLPPPSI